MAKIEKVDKRVVGVKELQFDKFKLLIGGVDEGLLFVAFGGKERIGEIEQRFRCKTVFRDNHSILNSAERQINEYLEKKRKSFDIPLILEGTDFQKKCWNALLTIPYGKTISYQQQATIVGNPKGVRAVGNANRVNPIPIIIPCHRVIGRNGDLRGYAAGVDKKIFLLRLEGVVL